MANPVEALLNRVKAEEQRRLELARSELGDISEQLTLGPEENTLSGEYSAGKGVWDIHFVDRINADVLLVLQSRLKQLYLRTGRPNMSAPIPRRIKDLLLLDRFPVHVVTDLGRRNT